jgi:hypothetical protein
MEKSCSYCNEHWAFVEQGPIFDKLLFFTRIIPMSCLLFVCFLGVTTHCGCIFHSPVAGVSFLVFEVS